MPTFTEAELQKLDRLSMKVSSRDQMDRISGRLDMRRFISEHGEPKCDAMWAEIKRRDKARAKRSGR